MNLQHKFDQIWAVDFEFTAPNGYRPRPIVMVAKDVLTGRVLQITEERLRHLSTPPFDTGERSLVISFYAPAEMACFLALGWNLPCCVVDLYAEFRCAVNGLATPFGCNLLGALSWFGLPINDPVEKGQMRHLAMRGGPFSGDEINALIRYCESDVDALALLWRKMAPRLNSQSLLRGEYSKAAARMEWTGVPLDASLYGRLTSAWESIKSDLVATVDPDGVLWEKGTFSEKRFVIWLQNRRIPWPLLASGRLRLDEETWSDMAKLHPRLAPVAELRAALSKMHRVNLSIGPDDRNRFMLSIFGSKTGRNQPSTTKAIFGCPRWMRGLIRPAPGHALAYVDWSQQEFGIAAVLSGDTAMIEAYTSSDPYLAFAIRAGAAPPGATKETHAAIRDRYKTVVLGVGYGMSAMGLAAKLGIHVMEAEKLLEDHRQCYPGFWRWSQRAADQAQLDGQIATRFGWELHYTEGMNERSLRNFPCQGNGAEMMRLAAIYATKSGVSVCTPVHDALLIEAPGNKIAEAVSHVQECMGRASEDVLGGFRLNSDVKIIRERQRFSGEGNPIWDHAIRLLTRHPCPNEQATPTPPGIPALSY